MEELMLHVASALANASTMAELQLAVTLDYEFHLKLLDENSASNHTAR